MFLNSNLSYTIDFTQELYKYAKCYTAIFRNAQKNFIFAIEQAHQIDRSIYKQRRQRGFRIYNNL